MASREWVLPVWAIFDHIFAYGLTVLEISSKNWKKSKCFYSFDIFHGGKTRIPI